MSVPLGPRDDVESLTGSNSKVGPIARFASGPARAARNALRERSGAARAATFPRRGARDRNRPAESLDAIDQPGQAGSARGFGAADALVADRHLQYVVSLFDDHLRPSSPGRTLRNW